MLVIMVLTVEQIITVAQQGFSLIFDILWALFKQSLNDKNYYLDSTHKGKVKPLLRGLFMLEYSKYSQIEQTSAQEIFTKRVLNSQMEWMLYESAEPLQVTGSLLRVRGLCCSNVVSTTVYVCMHQEKNSYER